MDYKLIFVILLTGHFLGDFYFQSQLMAEEKNKKCRIMIKHGIYYMVSTIAPFFFFIASLIQWLSILLVPLLHIIVDITKSWLCQKSFFKKHQGTLFVADQFIHILVIACVAYFYATEAAIAYSWLGIQFSKFYTTLDTGLSLHEIIRLACLILFLGKPVSIFVGLILKSVTTKETNTDPKAGRIIGILERYLTVILILLGQYAALAVSLTFTAKTLTRFNKISEDKDFAEQYLIGTMSSLLFALIGVILYR